MQRKKSGTGNEASARVRMLAAGMLLLTALPVGRTYAGYYTITLIASSDNGFRPLGLGLPTINNRGEVAFAAITDISLGFGRFVDGVFIGSGGPLTTVATRGDTFASFHVGLWRSIPSINDNGEVAFRASTMTGFDAIVRADAAGLTTIADTSGAFGTFGLIGSEPSINDAGTVAFGAFFDGFANAGFFKGSGGTPELVADGNSSPLRINPNESPAITNNGTVAFHSPIDAAAGGGVGYFTGPNLATDTLVDSNGPVIDRIATFDTTAINDAGTLAYVGSTAALSGNALITTTNGVHTVIADTLGPFAGFFSGAGSGPSINNHGDIVFRAVTDAGGAGIYTGPSLGVSPVVERGDPLFGSTMESPNLGISQQAINDVGQIAFRGRLANFVDFVARADPFPGSLPVIPLLPNPGDPGGAFDFDIVLTDNGLGVVDPIFIDPDFALGYDYALIDAGDPRISSVLLPVGIGDDVYELWLWSGSEWTLDRTLDGGVAHLFDAAGVDRFRILGIEPDAMLDPADPLAFVTGLTFATGNTTIDLTMTAIVPEPATLALLTLAGLAAARRRRARPAM